MSDQSETMDPTTEQPPAEPSTTAGASATAEASAPAKAAPAKAVPAASEPSSDRTRRKVRTGIVVSDKMEKTVLVRIDRKVRHRLYQKTVAKSNKLAAHDENNDAHIGDTVRLMETRPLSKSKRWRVVEIVERAK